MKNPEDPFTEVRVLKWRKVPREENSNTTAWSPLYEASDEHGVAG